MKRIYRTIIKTALITLWIAVLAFVAVFGVLSFTVPVKMMEWSVELGLYTVGADYAYEEYTRSGDIAYLARSFLMANNNGMKRTADFRFGLLYAEEALGDYCDAQEDIVVEQNGKVLASIPYRTYLMSEGALAKYRTAGTEEYGEVIDFAFTVTEREFPPQNPLFTLSYTAAAEGNGGFCTLLLSRLRESDFEQNETYRTAIGFLTNSTEELA